ncbi:DUF493 domain-containing protein [Chitinivibrio alkaliphilus]|uniref:DUF493 domain-containing protein n=1 Tax=Chitinivibrio alkaliphilus ACht1 TaxID=1313304 RepID=U7DEI0_9BACT|nr:DUF493 domain-containing protein [Chitinivibrio alkaliphilus]ERP39331.1 hypothetical protein CALK_0127 [Chitinivibrio alkaliphilus ACht1]
MEKPDIHYPTSWQYRIIGKKGASLATEIEQLLGNTNYTLEETNTTSKYAALKITLIVASEKERYAYFDLLKEHPSVKMVL